MRRYIAFVSGLSCIALQFIFQLTMGYFIGEIQVDLGFSSTLLTSILSGYYIIYSVFQLFAGLFLQRYGARLVLAIGSLSAALAMLIFAFSSQAWIMFLARMVMGMGLSCAFVGMYHVVVTNFKPEAVSLHIGVAESCGLILLTVFELALAIAMTQYSWRLVCVAYVLLALLNTLLAWYALKDMPKGYVHASKASPSLRADIKAFLSKHRIIYQDRNLWQLGLYAGISFAVMSVFQGIWAVPFLRLVHHLSLVQASHVTVTLITGLILGCAFAGYAMRVYRLQILFCAFPLIALCAFLAMIILHPLVAGLLMSINFILGFAVSSYVMAYVMAGRMVDSDQSLYAVGFINALISCLAPIMSATIGQGLHLLSFIQGHVGVYTAENYNAAMLLLPFSLMLMILLAYRIRHVLRLHSSKHLNTTTH